MNNLFAKLLSQPLAISEMGARQIKSLGGQIESRTSLDPEKWNLTADYYGNEFPKPYDLQGGVRVIPMHGPMTRGLGLLGQYFGMVDMDTVGRQIDGAEQDETVEMIVMDIQSPGGSAIGCAELAAKLRSSSKSTLAFTSDMMASAAYFVASGCEQIAASPSSLTGSIGTLLQLVDDSEYWRSMGIEWIVLRSGEYKGAGIDGYSEEQLAEMQSLVDAFGAQFRGFVSGSREIAAEDMRGQVYLAAEAQEKNFLDFVSENLIQAIQTAKARL
jgi:signal peptide peptidase SppA